MRTFRYHTLPPAPNGATVATVPWRSGKFIALHLRPFHKITLRPFMAVHITLPFLAFPAHVLREPPMQKSRWACVCCRFWDKLRSGKCAVSAHVCVCVCVCVCVRDVTGLGVGLEL
jgi:hypothetical protein